MTSVLIVDDHPVILQGLKHVLLTAGYATVAEASNSRQALELVTRHEPQAVILDLLLPDGDGLELLHRLRKKVPMLPALVFSMFDHPTFIARAIASGVNGFVLKSSPVETLLGSLQRVIAGEILWTTSDLRRLASALATSRCEDTPKVTLTHREIEILELIARGLSNHVIAQRLAISIETVKEHVRRILARIGVSDRTQAAVWGHRMGLIQGCEEARGDQCPTLAN